jgi:hypothetical protein
MVKNRILKKRQEMRGLYMRLFSETILFIALITSLLGACAEESRSGDDAGIDASTDSSTDIDCEGGGVWLDTESNLCWQEPPSSETSNWYIAAGVYEYLLNPDTDNYCAGLGSGWRLPTVSELRSLIRGCDATEWDMTWTEAPDDTFCGVWDSCLMDVLCYDSNACNPGECSPMGGPGADGCFWDAALGIRACAGYWSSSDNEENTTYAWFIDFTSGHVKNGKKSFNGRARCVLSAP